MGPAGRRRPRLGHAGARAVRAGGSHRQRAGRSSGRDGSPRGNVGPGQAQRDLGRAGARGPRPTVLADDGNRRAIGSPRRRRRAMRFGDDVVRARQHRCREVPPAVARRGRPATREGDRHVLDLYGRARPERVHVHRARDRLDGRRLRRRSLLGRRRTLGPAARRGAGVREADARRGSGHGRPREVGSATRSTRASASWVSGTASTAPRIPARSSSSATARELGSPQIEVAERLEEAASRRARASSSRAAAEDERRVLLGARPRRRRIPAAPRTGDVRLLARRRLVGAHPRAEANRPAVQAVCPVRRPRAASLASSA